MNTFWKKLVSGFLTVMMLLSVFPMAAFADTAETEWNDAAFAEAVKPDEAFVYAADGQASEPLGKAQMEAAYKFVLQPEKTEQHVHEETVIGEDGEETTEQHVHTERPFHDWRAELVVSFDRDVAAETVGLATRCDNCTDGNVTGWHGFLVDHDLKANEGLRLIGAFGNALTYGKLCEKVREVLCGVFNLDDANIGTKMSVSLRLFEQEGGAETGNFVTLASYDHKIEETVQIANEEPSDAPEAEVSENPEEPAEPEENEPEPEEIGEPVRITDPEIVEPADAEPNAEPEDGESGDTKADESSEQWTVTLTSRTEASSSSVCRLSGGGTYNDGESATVTAYPRKGYTFVGWYHADDTSFASQLSKQQSYTFTVTEDTSLVALFAVSQGTLFRLTVHGSLFVVNSGAVQSDMFTSTYNAGETMYVSYRDDTKEFLYWVNASGNILSTEKDFSFALASDTEISSYYAANDTTETTGMVIFRNAYKQVIQSRTYAVGQPISYPASNPNKMGYLFTGWYIADENGEPTETEATEEAIYAAMEGANAVVVVPGYVASGNEYTVTVAYTDTEGNALKDPVTKVMGVGNSKTFYAPTITGYNFQYWTLNGVKASYGNAYTIIYATPGEAKLCAVYAEGNVTPEPTIIITQTYSKYDESANKYIVSNTEQYFAPAEYVVMEVGFVWSKNAGLYGVAGGADKLELGAPDVNKHISYLTANEGISRHQ